MESFIESYKSEENPLELIEGDKMGKKVLIATLHSYNPVMLAVTRLGPERLILLVDNEPNKEQEESLALIQKSLGEVIEIKTKKTAVYDIVQIAKDCVDIIDMQPKEDIIYVNITSGRKTKAIGLLFAAYARHDRVKKVAYNPQEDKGSIVYLPRLSFKLTENQKKILELIDNKKCKTIGDFAEKIDLSTAMVYRAIGELEDMDFVEIVDEGYCLTDAGKIARL